MCTPVVSSPLSKPCGGAGSWACQAPGVVVDRDMCNTRRRHTTPHTHTMAAHNTCLLRRKGNML